MTTRKKSNNKPWGRLKFEVGFFKFDLEANNLSFIVILGIIGLSLVMSPFLFVLL